MRRAEAAASRRRAALFSRRSVVENARLATTFSNDNNYPRETSLPIRRERLLFFIYGQAHYFCASKHMKNSPLARSNPPFPFSLAFPFPSPPPHPTFACCGYRPVQRTSHGFIKLVATMRGLDPLSVSLSLSLSLLLSPSFSLLPRNFTSRPTHSHAIRRSVVASSGLLPGDLTRQSCIDHSVAIHIGS